jgi:hypothetical protein
MEMMSLRVVTFPLNTIPNFHASSQDNVSRQTHFSFCGHHPAQQEFVGETNYHGVSCGVLIFYKFATRWEKRLVNQHSILCLNQVRAGQLDYCSDCKLHLSCSRIIQHGLYHADQCVQIFQKPRSNHKIVSTRRVTSISTLRTHRHLAPPYKNSVSRAS